MGHPIGVDLMILFHLEGSKSLAYSTPDSCAGGNLRFRYTDTIFGLKELRYVGNMELSPKSD